MKPLQKLSLNHRLNMAGLASLEDPAALLSQVALGITDHDKFRQLLLKCEPDQRYGCYYSLAPRLKFEPKPLETYIIEGKQQAEKEQLPVYDHDTGKISPFGTPVGLNINALAEKAIKARELEEVAKGSLELVCRRCTLAEIFPAVTRGQALKAAEVKGWRPDVVTDKAICPKCSPKQIH